MAGAASRNFADLKRRVLSGLVLVAAAIAPLLLGGVVLALFVAAAAAAEGWEHRRVTLTGLDGIDAREAGLFGAALAAAALATGLQGLAAGLAVLAASALGFVVLDVRRRGGPSWAWGVAGIAAWGLAACCFVALREEPLFGLAIVLWIGCVVAATDIGAFFAGRLIGGPKLWPRVSPKKTWAGVFGGLAAAVAVGAPFAWVAPGGDPARLALVSGLAALVAQAGDLAESAFKRRFGVKDSSGLIPGHGGVLDRFDGLSAATLVAAATTFLRGDTVFEW